jgi:1,2-diacylglycerol 3-beta-glucosyltransferase
VIAALVAAVCLYAAVVGAVAVGAARLRRAVPPRIDDAALPRAVVVVPARDEEAILPRCLDALLAQDYPPERLLVVVADDHSADGTAAVAARYRDAVRLAVSPAVVATGGAPAADDARGDGAGPGLAALPLDRPRVLGVRVPDGGPLRGKAAALHAGVEASAAFDPALLLFTDADCAPPPGWCRAMAARLAEPGVGLVCGRTEVEAADAAGRARPMAVAEALDWTYLLTAAAVLTEAGHPASGMGNNMGLRRAAYDAVGGYPGVPFSVTEDHALFLAVARRTPWRVRFPLDAALAVRTLPLARLAEVYGQRRRWARGGLRAGPLLTAVYVVTYLGHLAVLAALGLAAAGAVPPGLPAALLAAKLGADYGLLRAALAPPKRRLLRAFPAAAALLFLYATTLPLALLLAPRVRWKGRTH